MDNSSNITEVELGENDEGRRLDRVLRIALPDLPLSAIFKALRVKRILVNGEAAKPDYRCKKGDRISFKNLNNSNIGLPAKPLGDTSLPEPRVPLDLHFLVRTPDILFLNKPLGVLVHGGNDSLEAQVRRYLEASLEPSLAFSPGPLHRLDRNTSGVLAFSCSYRGAREFTTALREHKIVKWYIAILDGVLEEDQDWEDMLVRDTKSKKTQVVCASQAQSLTGTGELDAQSGAAPEISRDDMRMPVAKTVAIPLATTKGRTLSLFQLQTGKTHQIRVQAASHGFALHGDIKYGAKRAKLPYYLHAIRMDLLFESLPLCPRTVVAPLPDYFIEALEKDFGMTQDALEIELTKVFERRL